MIVLPGLGRVCGIPGAADHIWRVGPALKHHICVRGGGYRGLCPALFSLSLSRSNSLSILLKHSVTYSVGRRKVRVTHTLTHTHTRTQSGYYHTMNVEQTMY